MKDKSASRIYLTNSKNEQKIVSLTKNGKAFTGHVGGISLSGDYAYISDGDRIYKIELSKIQTEDFIEIGEGIKVNNQASFTFADDEYLYVGEFNYADKYICENIIGDYKAICTKYSLDDLTTPVAIYSIRDKVQGIAFVDGYVVMSTSYGVADSVYYIYNEADAFDSGETLDGTKVYYLEECIKEFKGPAMGEDLDVYNGKIMTLTESASDKYIFGKFPNQDQNQYT